MKCKNCRKEIGENETCARCIERELEQNAISSEELSKIWWEGFMCDRSAENPYTKNYPKTDDVQEKVWWRVTDKRADSWLAGWKSCWKILPDYLGKIGQQNEGWLSPEEWENLTGEERLSWELIAEHERDDYRSVAELQIKFLLENGLLNVDKMRELIKKGKLRYPNYEHW